MRNIFKGWRTSIVGIFLLAMASYYIYSNTAPDYIVLGMLIVGGISLLFFPDSVIQQLKTFITKKSNEI